MICIEITETGQRLKLDGGFFVRRQRNGVLVRCPKPKRQGVCDGERVWSLGQLEEYPEARIITRAEYEEHLGTQTEPEAAPEDYKAALAELGVEV